jgi:hypothetical protein
VDIRREPVAAARTVTLPPAPVAAPAPAVAAPVSAAPVPAAAVAADAGYSTPTMSAAAPNGARRPVSLDDDLDVPDFLKS